MNEPTNPYAAPQAAIETRQSNDDDVSLTDASAGARFINVLVDSVLRVIFSTAVQIPFALAGIEVDVFLSVLLSLGTFFSYYIVFEAWLGRTPGKFLTGTRVVKTDGSALTVGDVIKRSLCRFVPFEPFSMFSSGGLWHDRWSGTRVVSVRRK